MGNSNWSEVASIFLVDNIDDWVCVNRNQDHDILMNSKTGEQCEQYYVISKSGRTHESMMQQYSFRNRQEGNIVKVLYAARVSAHTLCSVTDQYRVWTERICARLAEIAELQLQDCLFILVEVIHGYLVLFQCGKVPIVSNRAIGFTSRGQVKVWTNENYAIDNELPLRIVGDNHKQHLQTEVVQNLFNVLRQHCRGKQYPVKLQQKIAKVSNFESALDVVHGYCKQASLHLPSAIKLNYCKLHLKSPLSPQKEAKETSVSQIFAQKFINPERHYNPLKNTRTVRIVCTSAGKFETQLQLRNRRDAEIPRSRQNSLKGYVLQTITPIVSHQNTIGTQSNAILYKQQIQLERDNRSASVHTDMKSIKLKKQHLISTTRGEFCRGPDHKFEGSQLRRTRENSENIISNPASRTIVFPTTPNRQPIERVNNLIPRKNATGSMRQGILQKSMFGISARYSNKRDDSFTYALPYTLQEEKLKINFEQKIIPNERKEVEKINTFSTIATNEENDIVKMSLKDQSRTSLTPINTQYCLQLATASPNKPVVHFSPEKQPRATSPVQTLACIQAVTTQQQQAAVMEDQQPSVQELSAPSAISFDYCKLYSKTVNSFIYKSDFHKAPNQPLGSCYSKKTSIANSGNETGAESNIVYIKQNERAQTIRERHSEDVTVPRILKLQTQVDKLCNSFTKESFLSQKTTRQSSLELVAKMFPTLQTHESHITSSMQEEPSPIEPNLNMLNERHKQGSIYESRQA